MNKLTYYAPASREISLRPMKVFAGSFGDGSLGDLPSNWNSYNNWDDDDDE